MFNNTIKKFAAVGLVFSLCAPCSFVYAQSFGRNGMNIPMGNSDNQQNRAIDENFFNNSVTEDIIIQPQSSGLDRLWTIITNHFNQNHIIIHGRFIRSTVDLSEYLRAFTTDPLMASKRLTTLFSSLRYTFPEFHSIIHDAISEIYNMT